MLTLFLLFLVRKARAVSETLELAEPLTVEVHELLYAFQLAEAHAKGRSHKERLNNQQEIALALIDWAICECDRGAQLLKEKTREGYDK